MITRLRYFMAQWLIEWGIRCIPVRSQRLGIVALLNAYDPDATKPADHEGFPDNPCPGVYPYCEQKPAEPCTHGRDLSKPCPTCPPGTPLSGACVPCACGGEGCTGPDDNERHQCGGPRESCGVPECRECGTKPAELCCPFPHQGCCPEVE